MLAAFALAAGFAGGMSVPASLAATQAEASKQQNACFFSRNWQGSKAVDEHTLYLRTGPGNNSIYRVDFERGCHDMNSPFAKFIQITRGSGAICTPLDLDLYVSTTPGVKTACLATGLRKLSPAEAAALPKNARP
jgi:hypothetical protein